MLTTAPRDMRRARGQAWTCSSPRFHRPRDMLVARSYERAYWHYAHRLGQTGGMSGGWAQKGACSWVGAGLLWGGAGASACRGRGDLLCRHHKRQRDLDVGSAGADGTRTIGDGEQVAEGVGKASVHPVSDNYPCSGYGIEQEILGAGQTHQFIVGRPARLGRSGWWIIGSEFDVPATGPVVLPGKLTGTTVERQGT